MSFLRTLISASAQSAQRRVHGTPSVRLASRRWSSTTANTSSQAQTRFCRSCSKPLPSTIPACPSCWTIYTVPSNMSHYDLLEIPEDPNPFVVDLKLLKQRFRKAQAACHPDAWASKDAKYLPVAQNLSSQVNAAYNALSDPLHRATYLLEQNGHSIEEADKMEDTEFIGNVMNDINSIEEAQEADVEEVREIEKNTQTFIEDVLKDIERSIDKKDWATVKDLVFKLRMTRRVQDYLQSWWDGQSLSLRRH